MESSWNYLVQTLGGEPWFHLITGADVATDTARVTVDPFKSRGGDFSEYNRLDKDGLCRHVLNGDLPGVEHVKVFDAAGGDVVAECP